MAKSVQTRLEKSDFLFTAFFCFNIKKVVSKRTYNIVCRKIPVQLVNVTIFACLCIHRRNWINNKKSLKNDTVVNSRRHALVQHKMCKFKKKTGKNLLLWCKISRNNIFSSYSLTGIVRYNLWKMKLS